METLQVCFSPLARADNYLKIAVAIRMDTGDRSGEAADYRHLTIISQRSGLYDKGHEYHEKALAIHKEISNREVVANCKNLVSCSQSLGNNDIA